MLSFFGTSKIIFYIFTVIVIVLTLFFLLKQYKLGKGFLYDKHYNAYAIDTYTQV